MKKGNTTKKDEAKIYNDIAITLTAWEYIEGRNADRLRCSAYAGKDKDGKYNKDIPVQVYITKDTDDSGFAFEDGRTVVDVVGQIAFGRYNDQPTVTIFASKISSR